MVRSQIEDYLGRFVESFAPPIAEGARATKLRARDGGTFEISTTLGTLTADQVVIATGPYQVPRRPPSADRLPDRIGHVQSSESRNADQRPEGAVLIVGTGQSGCQI